MCSLREKYGESQHAADFLLGTSEALFAFKLNKSGRRKNTKAFSFNALFYMAVK